MKSVLCCCAYREQYWQYQHNNMNSSVNLPPWWWWWWWWWYLLALIVCFTQFCHFCSLRQLELSLQWMAHYVIGIRQHVVAEWFCLFFLRSLTIFVLSKQMELWTFDFRNLGIRFHVNAAASKVWMSAQPPYLKDHPTFQVKLSTLLEQSFK